jgi:cytochrome P450
MLVAGSANMDPAAFPDPERLDLARAPQGHLTFCQGLHFCLGASLARAQLQVALGALLRGAGAWEVEPGPLRYRKGIGRVLKKLPLRLER